LLSENALLHRYKSSVTLVPIPADFTYFQLGPQVIDDSEFRAD
jgi:hypothetical protein